jgi:hypothetical protein
VRQKPAVPPPQKTSKKGGNKEVGNALRTVYDETLSETVPPEMLDLLGKLS